MQACSDPHWWRMRDEGRSHIGVCVPGRRFCDICRMRVFMQARADPQWWRMREAVLLAAAEVQEDLSDISGGAAFQTSLLLDMVLAQASSLLPCLVSWIGPRCHD